jgi:hypothetical protein
MSAVIVFDFKTRAVLKQVDVPDELAIHYSLEHGYLISLKG